MHSAYCPEGSLVSKSKGPLHTLARVHRLSDCKPARLFTSIEKGKVSSIYNKCKKVWKLIQGLINKRSKDYQIICDAIYAAYGHESVTTIIKNIQRDGKTGSHPNLESP